MSKLQSALVGVLLIQTFSTTSHAGTFDLFDESARTASGVVVGISTGNTRLKVNGTPMGDLADKAQTGRLILGYRFNRYLSAEGFSETGVSFAARALSTREMTGLGPETRQGFGAQSKVFGVNVVGTLWSGKKLSVNVRAGAVFAKQRATLSEYIYDDSNDESPPVTDCSHNFVSGCATSESAEDDNLKSETHRNSSARIGGYSTGVGFAVQFLPRLRIAADADWRRGMNSESFFDHTLTLHSAEAAWSVGLVYGPF